MTAEDKGVVALDHLTRALVDRMDFGASGEWGAEDFGALALRVFDVQFEHNVTYRRFCESRGVTPASVGHWHSVPSVPARAFKHLDIVCGTTVEAVFETSGTTSDVGHRGRHHVPSLELYRSSLLPLFARHLVPEETPIRFLSLVPSAVESPASSLSFMVSAAAEELASRCDYVIDGSGAVDEPLLRAAISDANATGEPVLLLGTAFAFVNLIERGELEFGPLPEGSRIMETGGFKGLSRAVPRAELYAMLSKATGVPESRIVNEYGMTELLSQLYEPVLHGEPMGCGHVAPPWLSVRALDPTTLKEMPEGESGILSFFDLANAGSVAHVLTEDFGSIRDGRLFLEGRAAGAEPRGCSRAMDDLMAVVR